MKTNVRTEWGNILVVAIPFIYLATIWSSLPETVPIHWNARGEVDDWGSKYILLIIPILLPLLTYVLLVAIPHLDPKKKIAQMGKKYHQLKTILTLFMSALAILILYATQNADSFDMGRGIFLLIGVMFLALGNYFQTIQPNYFVGIRTPWTLESETVWKETHRFGGKVWMVGGIVTILCMLILPSSLPVVYICIGISLLLAFIPIVYSYQRFQKEKRQSNPTL